MRTIKFRGKHLCGQWYYGNLILREVDSPVPETNQAYKCVYIGDIEDGSEEQVEEETVGQFTGLHDKNGKEIYEGDIIKEDNLIHEIRWIDKASAFCRCHLEDARIRYRISRDDMRYVEVIGNIHDNPELLKGGEQ